MKNTILTLLVFLLLAGTATAAGVGFRWDANTEPDLGKYKLYQTDTSGQYTKAQVIGEGSLVAIIMVDLAAVPPISPTEYRLEGVADGRHYWVMTATDLSNNESGFSNEVTTIIDSVPPAPPGGLSIWEIIIAFIKRVLDWLA